MVSLVFQHGFEAARAKASRRVYSSLLSACRGGPLPKHPLLRPISIAIACWSRVADGFPKTAETVSHFVRRVSRSPVHPANIKASNRIMILIRAPYSNCWPPSDCFWTISANRGGRKQEKRGVLRADDGRRFVSTPPLSDGSFSVRECHRFRWLPASFAFQRR
jgi:hypothetical protein